MSLDRNIRKKNGTGSVLLLAVPGSGKTTVLVTRLGYMISCSGIAPQNILTLTYAVAATQDMQRRFENYLAREAPQDLNSGPLTASAIVDRADFE